VPPPPRGAAGFAAPDVERKLSGRDPIMPAKPFLRRSARAVALLVALVPTTAAVAAEPPGGAASDLLLITLDTTRADALGCYGAARPTPTLDRLAATGVRYSRALAPTPLTLPSHASLLTGLDPVEHGVRGNGGDALPVGIPTLAERLHAAGYATAAVVASRVLDRRFGLGRGFDEYDDRMVAERVGEFGEAERGAATVVDAALAAASRAPADRPLFLWAHFYDPHAPYEGAGEDARARYLAEVATVDREVGRLLERLSAVRPRPRVVAAVGDHGEAFGEGGEIEHGFLLHDATLAVPLILAGPNFPAGREVATPVAARRLAATLLANLGGDAAGLPGPPLPVAGAEEPTQAIYHETLLPRDAHGWRALSAVTLGRWRLVRGARTELYDLESGEGESKNRATDERPRTRQLAGELDRMAARPPAAAPRRLDDPELAATLESLGYLGGARRREGELDPRDGMELLARYRAAKLATERGDLAGARRTLRELVAKSPESAHFLGALAEVEMRAGSVDAALATIARAVALDPGNPLQLVHAAELELQAGRRDAGESLLRRAVAISPRFAQAWLLLGETLARSGRAAEEEAVLRKAVEAETGSAAIWARLGEIALRRGDLESAESSLAHATELLPEWPAPWRLWAEVAERRGDAAEAARRRARGAGRSGS